LKNSRLATDRLKTRPWPATIAPITHNKRKRPLMIMANLAVTHGANLGFKLLIQSEKPPG